MTAKCTGGDSHELLDNPFTESRLVAVEGRHDQTLFAALIDYLDLDSFQVHSFGGKTGWRKKVLAVGRNDSFLDNVRRVGLVRDADADGSAAWQSCVDAVKALDFIPPDAPYELASEKDGKRFAIMVAPEREATGALEELILPALDPQRVECVDRMYECLSAKSISFRGASKEKLQVYLGTFEFPVRDTTVALGKSLIDLDHPTFDPAKQFLRNIASD